jgi:HK97 family phage major capsid protein
MAYSSDEKIVFTGPKAPVDPAQRDLERREAEILADARADLAEIRTESAARLEQIREHAARQEAWTAAEAAAKLTKGAQKNARRHLRAAVGNSDPAAQQQSQAKALAAAERSIRWKKAERDLRKIARVDEPAPYGPTSPHSYFYDIVTLSDRDPSHRDRVSEARARLDRHAEDMRRLAAKPGAKGEAVRAAFRDQARQLHDRDKAEKQYRAMTSGATSGGSFLTPDYVVNDYALYRSFPPVVLERAVTQRPLPDHGMTVSVPRFTSGTNGGVQSTENTLPAEVDPSGGYVTANVGTYVGWVTGSQQLYDRAGPLGFDQVIYSQLREQVDAALDVAVINALLAAPNTVTRTTSTALGAQMLLSDVGQAAARLETTAGTRLAPTAFVAPAAIGEWLFSVVDTSGTPLFKPSGTPGNRADGVTGYQVSGIDYLIDDNVPASGSAAQLLVLSNQAAYAYVGQPIVDALPASAEAGSLSVIFRMRRYAAIDVRFPSGVSVISGTGYPAAPTFP